MRLRSTNPAKPIAEARKQSHVHSGQPACWPWIKGRTRSPEAPAMMMAASPSMRTVASPVVRGSIFHASAAATMPIGMLTRNTLRQPMPKRLAWMMKPPMMGPRMPPSPKTGPKTAKALANSSSGNAWRMRPKPCGSNMAAVKPSMSRNVINQALVGAMAHRSEEIVKATTPKRNIWRRPKRSPSRPPSTRPEPRARA